jgi:ubiquinone/menaquinone biosynthesis C-methylase UbiE
MWPPGTAIALWRRPARGARVVASDLTPALVQLGRARTQADRLAIQWVLAAAEALPFADERLKESA